jgi:hypothetical protein
MEYLALALLLGLGAYGYLTLAKEVKEVNRRKIPGTLRLRLESEEREEYADFPREVSDLVRSVTFPCIPVRGMEVDGWEISEAVINHLVMHEQSVTAFCIRRLKAEEIDSEVQHLKKNGWHVNP